MDAIDAEVRRDGDLLTDVLQLLASKAPLRACRRDAVSALAAAIDAAQSNPVEREKALRLQRHLFSGPPPEALACAGTPSRRADRLRADLADLVGYGAGLHLLADAR